MRMAGWPSLMRNRFDHLAKQIGQKALGPFGTAVTQDAINPETQYADSVTSQILYTADEPEQAREELAAVRSGRILPSSGCHANR